MPVFVVVLATVAAISYATFLLEHFLSPDLDVINGYVSELSAVDQPFHNIYSGGDFITGVLTIVVAATGLLRLTRRPWATAGWIFLLLFGIGAIGDATFPLDCAPSLDTRCALLERGEKLSFAHGFHAFTSSFVVCAAVLALFSLSMAGRRYGWWPPLARWGWVLAVAETVCGFSTLGFMVYGSWLGLVQRIQISILVAGLAVLAWALYDDRRRAGSVS